MSVSSVINNMQLLVRGVDGKSKVIRFNSSSLVSDVINEYCLKHGLPQDLSKFIYSGKVLMSEKPVTSYGIGDNSTIQLVSSLNGGIIEPSMRVLATEVNCNTKVCRKCYARLPARAENCRKRKCGHSANIRPKKMPR